MDRNKEIKLINRLNCTVCYTVPDLGVDRVFNEKETKIVTFDEIEKLSYTQGGKYVLENALIIDDEEARAAILGETEPEYAYTEKDILNLLKEGTNDEFLDMLDFAPKGVLDLVKELAVKTKLSNMDKRQFILDKTGFDVTAAIAIEETPYDSAEAEKEEESKPTRRVKIDGGDDKPKRRASGSKYKVIE